MRYYQQGPERAPTGALLLVSHDLVYFCSISHRLHFRQFLVVIVIIVCHAVFPCGIFDLLFFEEFLIFCKDNILITDKSSSSRNEFTDDDVLLKTFLLVC
ncbi:MAG: hypothetical protein MR687_09205, partial [Spirochaetales bacterium]|nr:hypothetical protein [Spirochaetales bacterium]